MKAYDTTKLTAEPKCDNVQYINNNYIASFVLAGVATGSTATYIQ